MPIILSRALVRSIGIGLMVYGVILFEVHDALYSPKRPASVSESVNVPAAVPSKPVHPPAGKLPVRASAKRSPVTEAASDFREPKIKFYNPVVAHGSGKVEITEVNGADIYPLIFVNQSKEDGILIEIGETLALQPFVGNPRGVPYMSNFSHGVYETWFARDHQLVLAGFLNPRRGCKNPLLLAEAPKEPHQVKITITEEDRKKCLGLQ